MKIIIENVGLYNSLEKTRNLVFILFFACLSAEQEGKHKNNFSFFFYRKTEILKLMLQNKIKKMF